MGTLSIAMIWDFVIAISSARIYSWRLICLSDSPILVLPGQLSMMKMVKSCYPIPFVRVSTFFSPNDLIIRENLQSTHLQGWTIENLESRFWTLLSNVQIPIRTVLIPKSSMKSDFIDFANLRSHIENLVRRFCPFPLVGSRPVDLFS